MSPIKRALEESSIHSVNGLLLSPKRLRGGGGGGGDDDDNDIMEEAEEQLYTEVDDLLEEEQAAADDNIPDEILEEQAALLDVAVAIKEKERQRWKRPALDPFYEDYALNNTRDMNVQWLDMDVVSGKPLTRNPNASKSKIAGSCAEGGAVPILRTFGVEDQTGHSVAVFIHGYTPYAYFALPPGMDVAGEADMDQMRLQLDQVLKDAARGNMYSSLSSAVIGIVAVRDHKSIMGYQSPHSTFLKVYVALPGLIAPLKRIMEMGIRLPGIVQAAGDDDDNMNNNNSNNGMVAPMFAPFECNVPFVLRFMVDRNLAGAGWLTLPKDTYQIRQASAKETHCQVRLFTYIQITHISINSGRGFSSLRYQGFSILTPLFIFYFACASMIDTTVGD
jgi:DNA polymerase delta subunit 1